MTSRSWSTFVAALVLVCGVLSCGRVASAEIQVFGQSPSDRDLAQLTRRANSPLATMPWVEKSDFGEVRRLITELCRTHGSDYAQGPEHLARLRELERAEQEADDDASRLEQVADDLEQLERDVLLFDVDKLVVIKRHEITASHVYTYHYEGFRPGGGARLSTGSPPTTARSGTSSKRSPEAGARHKACWPR